MPIAILEIPRAVGTQVSKESARELCETAENTLHESLRVPNPGDKEIRVVESNSDETTLTVSFTVGPNEYPEYEPPYFLPTREQVAEAGLKIKELILASPIKVKQVTIESWRDTTFLLWEDYASEPTAPVSQEELRKIGTHIHNPKIRLFLSPFLSPLKFQGSSISKEGGRIPEIEDFPKVSQEISRRLIEIFGLPEGAISQEVVFTQAADTDVSVEFDCETGPNNSLPQEVREYMAESVLYILDSSRPTRKGSKEVWIRQGQPERLEFNK